MAPPVIPVLPAGAFGASTTAAAVSRLTTGMEAIGAAVIGAATTLLASAEVPGFTTGAVTTRDGSVVVLAWLLSVGTVRLSTTGACVALLSTTGAGALLLTGALYSEAELGAGATTTCVATLSVVA